MFLFFLAVGLIFAPAAYSDDQAISEEQLMFAQPDVVGVSKAAEKLNEAPMAVYGSGQNRA